MALAGRPERPRFNAVLMKRKNARCSNPVVMAFGGRGGGGSEFFSVIEGFVPSRTVCQQQNPSLFWNALCHQELLVSNRIRHCYGNTSLSESSVVVTINKLHARIQTLLSKDSHLSYDQSPVLNQSSDWS